jgi:hypothetical protein
MIIIFRFIFGEKQRNEDHCIIVEHGISMEYE